MAFDKLIYEMNLSILLVPALKLFVERNSDCRENCDNIISKPHVDLLFPKAIIFPFSSHHGKWDKMSFLEGN